MKNPFGAKITKPVMHNTWQSYYIALDQAYDFDYRRKTMKSVGEMCQQLMLKDSNGRYLFVVANEKQSKRIETLAGVKAIGAVHIDFERFQAIMSGNF